MIEKIKCSFSEAVIYFKRNWRKSQPLKHLTMDAGLIVLGGVLIFIPILVVQIIGVILVFFVVCLPMLILLSSFFYFILTIFSPIDKNKYKGNTD